MIRIAIIGAAIAALLGALWWFGDSRYDAGYEKAAGVYQAAIDKQKTESRAILDVERAKVSDLEKRLGENLAQQNLKDAKNVQVAADYERRLAAAGRLRDPKATGRGGSGSCTQTPNIATTDSCTTDSEQAPGLLSAETSNDLRSLAREADALNIAYESCRADALNLRANWPK